MACMHVLEHHEVPCVHQDKAHEHLAAEQDVG